MLNSLLSLTLATSSLFDYSENLEPYKSIQQNVSPQLSFSSKRQSLKKRALSLSSNNLVSDNLARKNQSDSKTEKLILKKIEFLGNTVFSDEELTKVVETFLNKEFSVEQSFDIRAAITDFYVNQGYTTSAAFAPPQKITDGVLKIQIVEGRLERLEIEGLERVNQGYVRSRLMMATKPPLNIQRLKKALELLQNNRLFEKVEAELKEGTAQGLSILSVKLVEAPALTIALQADNYALPSSGEEQGTIEIEHQNLLGFGDRLSASYGITEGLDKYDLSYAVPVNARDGTFTISYRNDETVLVEDPFADIGIRAEGNTFSVGFRQPLIKSLTEEFSLSLSFDLRESQTYILDDIPFSFAPGTEEGKSRVSVLRLAQEWVNRSTSRVLAARSQLSFGLDLFDATINDLGIDGDFFSWIGQFQWVEKLDENILLVTRIDTQLSPDSLLPIEQFGIGGIDTVRGYRQNLRAGDNGINSSIEARFTVFDERQFGRFELVPFFDFGVVWNNQSEVSDPNTLASTGLGLRWQLRDSVFVRLDYGIPLIDVEEQGNSLQEDGFSFSVRWQTRF